MTEVSEWAVLCPRCEVNHFTPYGVAMEEGWDYSAPRPALSRTTRGGDEEEKVYVCPSCGQDEAMEEWDGGTATPQDKWPVKRPGAFGQGSR